MHHRMFKFSKLLYDLGESINLMPFVMFRKLAQGNSKPIPMRLLMAYFSINITIGVLYDALVKVD